jgi:hypothetical protein
MVLWEVYLEEPDVHGVWSRVGKGTLYDMDQFSDAEVVWQVAKTVAQWCRAQ